MSRAEILQVIAEQQSAVAKGDASGVIAPLAPDVIMYDLPPPLEYRGAGAQAASGLNDWFNTWENGVTVELDNPTVIVNGDLAVVFGLSRMRGTKKGEGPVDMWNCRTVVLRQRKGRWEIIHEHDSYPTKMDGTKELATDLKP